MILQRILEHKRAELRHKTSRRYVADLKARIADRQTPLPFLQSLQKASRPTAPALIAEVKKASPSQGLMRPEFADHFDPVAIAHTYCQHGAAAISVLTDRDFFQGSLEYLAAVKDQVGLPTLNKEFMIGDIQFYEARAYGADAVLLIVAGLDRIQLEDFVALARELHLEVLIETHHEREVDLVLERIPDVRLVGINNRDLHTFSTDLTVTERLAKRLPPEIFLVSESGLHKRDDVLRIAEAGAKGMLVGEALLKADSITDKIRELLGVSASQEEHKACDEDSTSTRWV
ncbi:MAG: indole-3-glycerol phosphate synthase TrpC [Nitrospirae bacterium]|nr:MAG: indole-3-glycerol phosphate synthase TrpC [Nitrospirota bacterium]